MTNGFSATPGQTRRNFAFRNDGGILVRDQVSVIATDRGWSYGASFGDYDDDGDLDLFVANWLDDSQENYLYRNDATGNRWLQVRCVGTVSNRSGIGARILVTAIMDGESVTQVREVSGANGYSSQNLVEHFGLGDAGTVESIEVRWPSGVLQRLHDVSVDQKLTIVEQSSVDVGENLGSSEFRFAPPHPNPTRGASTVVFEVSRAAHVRLAVYDVTGRVTRELFERTFEPGRHVARWDGRDERGQPVGAGVYFLRWQAGTDTAVQRVIRLDSSGQTQTRR